MSGGDFYGSEKSTTLSGATSASIVFSDSNGTETTLKTGISLQDKEVIDCSVMKMSSLKSFLTEQVEEAKGLGVLFSLHMKATMMKVSDPIIFGAAVSVFYKEIFTKYGDLFSELGVNPNNGIGDVYAKIAGH